MLPGLIDPPLLHPTLMRNHMTCDASTSGWTVPSKRSLPSTLGQISGRNWRVKILQESSYAGAMWAAKEYFALIAAFTETVA